MLGGANGGPPTPISNVGERAAEVGEVSGRGPPDGVEREAIGRRANEGKAVPGVKQLGWEEGQEGICGRLVVDEEGTPRHNEEGWCTDDGSLSVEGELLWPEADVRRVGTVDMQVDGADGGALAHPETEGQCHKDGNEGSEVPASRARLCDGNKGLDREPLP